MTDPRFLLNALTAGLLVTLFVFIIALHTGTLPVQPEEYETTTVTITDDTTNVTKATLDARQAETLTQKYVGLGHTDSLSDDDGMLFTFNSSQQRTISMRGMSFPLDIIYIGEDGRITKITSADNPEGVVEAFTYESVSGNGVAVLEVRRGWAEKHNVTEGDRVTWSSS